MSALSGPNNRLHFPAKIYLILENESPDIIRWHPNNKAFRIIDHSRFEREIIPKYFRHNQMSSVQRQLNLYGFKCVSRGEDKGSFYNPKFQRGDWEGAKQIRRCVSHSQFGMNWKLPGDMNQKRFDDSTKSELQFPDDLDSFTNTETADIKHTSSMDSTMIDPNQVSYRKNDPSVWNTNTIKKESSQNFNTSVFNSCDLTRTMVNVNSHTMMNIPTTFTSSSALTYRLGFKWNNSTDTKPIGMFEGDMDMASGTNADLPRILGETEFSSDFANEDNFQDLLAMCNDLDTFLQECDAPVW